MAEQHSPRTADHHDDCSGIHSNRPYNFAETPDDNYDPDATAPFNVANFIAYCDKLDRFKRKYRYNHVTAVDTPYDQYKP